MNEQSFRVIARSGTEELKNVVILLHGYGADGRDLAPLADVLDPEKKYHFIFPEGFHEVPIGPHMTGRAWFPLNMQEIEQAMAAGTYRSYVDSIPDHFQDSIKHVAPLIYDLSQKYEKVILGGFSQGGMVASHLALSSLVEIEKLILMSTTLVGEKVLTEFMNLNARRFPVFLSHGEQDPVLSPKIAREFSDLLGKNGFPVESHHFAGGHEIPHTTVNHLAEFLKKAN